MKRQRRRSLGGALHGLLLRFPAEMAHDLGIAALRFAGSLPGGNNYLGSFSFHDARLEQRLLGSKFPNPLGLAAGFDKDGLAMSALSALGFGLIEVGTVTRRPQEGNQRPRLFRHPAAATLENAMGFNNAGADALSRRLEDFYPGSVPLGVNVGKNKKTPNAEAVVEYGGLVQTFDRCCDYFVINVSSPNTPGLRDLQTVAAIHAILGAARAATTRPILFKLSPDLETAGALELAEEAIAAGADGIVLTNTTVDYDLLPSAHRIGGLSGRVLRERSRELIVAAGRRLFGRCLLVSVGGIDSGREVYRRLRAGASLVQIYSALAFRGPALIGSILSELLECLDRDGLDSVEEAVGADL